MLRSIKAKILYEKFLQDAKKISLKSKDGSIKKVVKWKDKIFTTGSFQEAYESAKKIMK